MDVSIIIVNYFSEKMICDCIKSVFNNTEGLEYEVIVVDNGSSEEGKSLLSSLCADNIHILDAGGNLGFGKANNFGASHAKGEYLLLLNPDTLLMNNAIKILHEYMKSNENVGVCGGNLYSPEGEPTPSFCRNFDTLIGEKKAASWFGVVAKKINDITNRRKSKELSEFNYSEAAEEVAYIFGADMLMKKELFHSLNGFDKDFFMYSEEEELQRRVSKRGLKIISVPDAKIIHLEGATSSEQGSWSPRQFAMRMKGKLTYFDKCYPPNGASEFYKYRRSRYQKQILWQKLKGKTVSSRAVDILDQVYSEYCNERGV